MYKYRRNPAAVFHASIDIINKTARVRILSLENSVVLFFFFRADEAREKFVHIYDGEAVVY